jgi:hypothetical protein
MPLSSASNAGKLPLEILVAVDAELGIVGKIGAEFQEERPEVLIDAVEIVVVDHRGGFHDPRIGSAGVPAAASRGQKGNVAEPTRVKKARTSHPGAARALAENRDATRDIYAERCACCAALEEAGQELARAWDHVDLPPIEPITTRINLFHADAGGHLRYR